VPATAAWEGEKVSDTEIRYRYRNDQIEMVKTFTVLPDDFLVKVALEVKAVGSAELKQRIAVTTFGYQDPKLDIGGGMGRVERKWTASCQLGDDISSTTAPDLAEKGEKERAGNLKWAGFNHPYMIVASAPKNDGGETIACNSYPVEGHPGMMRVDLVWSSATLRAGEPSLRRELIAYLGPKYYEKLEGASAVAGYPTHFEDTVDLGWFSFIARPLLWLLQKLHGYVGNWGLAIIMVTFLVKLATLYWTNKSMRSMRAMAALAPKMKALQEKHKDDRQRLQAETMALYKSHGVNPLAGCLPILLQMPIWIALYRMLSSAGELYYAPFISGWILDLTERDPFHILPISMMAGMFLQSRLTPSSGQDFNQKMLMYGMPIMFGVFGFFMPAGLGVYILFNTVLTILHTLYMNRGRGKEIARAEAAKPETVKVGESSEEISEASDSSPHPPSNGQPAARPRRSSRSSRRKRG
jgi:YidC/Oxa1 family membrane protein insertase